MKKTLVIAVALAITSISSFAQGNINFGGSIREVWNTETNGAPVNKWTSAGSFYVTLLFSTVSPSSVSAVSATGSSTNQSVTYLTSSAWTDVASDLSGTWKQVTGTDGTTAAVASGTTSGTWSYNSSSAWSAANLTAGTTYYMYEVAWDTDGGLYTTLAAAEAAGAYVGWSQVFTYTPTSGSTGATVINAALAGYYGVGGTVPEPTTMALLGLGGLSLLVIRRRK
jgi:hypothetical protein